MPSRRLSRSLGRLLATLRATALLVGILVFTAGCRNMTGEPLPDELRSIAFCVERHSRDQRNLALQIADSLRASGLGATTSDAGACPEESPYLVTYIDNWVWDIRMYLSKLTIEVLDASNGEIVAFGESNQPSLAALGSSHRDVIDRAVSQLLGVE